MVSVEVISHHIWHSVVQSLRRFVLHMWLSVNQKDWPIATSHTWYNLFPNSLLSCSFLQRWRVKCQFSSKPFIPRHILRTRQLHVWVSQYCLNPFRMCHPSIWVCHQADTDNLSLELHFSNPFGIYSQLSRVVVYVQRIDRKTDLLTLSPGFCIIYQ